MSDSRNPSSEGDYEQRLTSYADAVDRASGFDREPREDASSLFGIDGPGEFIRANLGTGLASIHLAHPAVT